MEPWTDRHYVQLQTPDRSVPLSAFLYRERIWQVARVIYELHSLQHIVMGGDQVVKSLKSLYNFYVLKESN